MTKAIETITMNSEIAKLKNDIQDSISFLETQAENEGKNFITAKSDWLQGVCEGRKLAYEIAVSILKRNLEKYPVNNNTNGKV